MFLAGTVAASSGGVVAAADNWSNAHHDVTKGTKGTKKSMDLNLSLLAFPSGSSCLRGEAFDFASRRRARYPSSKITGV
jgi:hypothetical protein